MAKFGNGMSCQKLGLWDKALQLLWQMEASGFPVPNASYNLVIGTCEVARKPKIALQVYEHMVHLKCAPDTFTLLSMIRCCIWGSLWHEVEEILNVSSSCTTSLGLSYTFKFAFDDPLFKETCDPAHCIFLSL